MIDPDPFKGEKRLMRADFREYSPKEFKQIYEWQLKHRKNQIKKHELTHYLRDKKGKWSFNNARRSYIASMVEEMAAYSRQEGSKWKGFTNTLDTQMPKVWKMLSKIGIKR